VFEPSSASISVAQLYDRLRAYDRGFDARELDGDSIQPLITPDELRRAVAEIRAGTVDDVLISYITAVVEATRRSPDLLLGGSPRASIGLLMASKTLAALRGRSYVTPDDVKDLAHPLLRHRIILRPEAEIEGLTPDRVIERVLAAVPVPR
jgi:MoxR-like ATPase